MVSAASDGRELGSSWALTASNFWHAKVTTACGAGVPGQRSVIWGATTYTSQPAARSKARRRGEAEAKVICGAASNDGALRSLVQYEAFRVLRDAVQPHLVVKMGSRRAACVANGRKQLAA